MSRVRLLALAVVALSACAPPPSTELYPHPFPDERLRREDGSLALHGFPAGTGAPIRRQAIDSLRNARGFGTASGVLFPMAEPLDPDSLPSVEVSEEESASVFVIDVDVESAQRGRRAPIDVRFLADGGPFGGTNLLVALPYPGIPLAPDTLYAAVVTNRTLTRSGAPLETTADLDATDAHGSALRVLAAEGVDPQSIASLAVFRTDDPVRELRLAVAQALREEAPPIEGPVQVESYEGYCVYRATIDMPVYQGGAPPYARSGGEWVRGEDGALLRQSTMRSRVWITIPRERRRSRLPSALFIRAGGGGDRPLVDRGRRDREGRSAPGTGIAREISAAGFVGLSVDGPLGGARNHTGWDEQTAIFNLLNPTAMRDNVRQSALELVLFAHALDDLVIDASTCDGTAAEVRVDPHPVLIGHSTGATIAPLAAAVEPRFGALVMSGAGASWVRQLMYKQSPEPLRPLAEILFGYWPHGHLNEHDPMLGLLQWAGEPADPMVHARYLDDRHVLVFQGVLDTYIPPPIANPMALSLDVDLAGDALDEDLPFRPLVEDLALIGRGEQALPARGSAAEPLRVVTHHPPDGIEDGHEILFQRPDARRQLRLFLESLALGEPRLVAP